ncbi:MAG: hypothetical protein GX979_12465 [Firmicutes bacterium]|nr:hypothetical protein [Bacillota bacterium]
MFEHLTLLTDFSGGDFPEEWTEDCIDRLLSGGLIDHVQALELEDSEPLVSATGNKATWTKTYSIQAIATTVDEQKFTCEYTLAFEVSLVKDSGWKIERVDVSVDAYEQVPTGHIGWS